MRKGRNIIFLILILVLGFSLSGCQDELPKSGPLGIIGVFSNIVGSQVTIDGIALGKTPYHGQFEAGTYQVRVSAPGYTPWEQKVVLTNGQRLVLEAQLISNVGGLRIKSSPAGAQVKLGDRLYQTPANLDSLTPGSYEFQIEKEFYQSQKLDVMVRAGEVSVIEVTLELEPPDLDAVRTEAERLANRLVEPLRAKQARVAEVSPMEIYLNKGMGEINLGERYEIVGAGVPVYDPNTGDLLGYQEQQRGIIQITKVRENMAIGTPLTTGGSFTAGDLAYQLVETKKLAVYRLVIPGRSDSLLAWSLQEALLTALAQYPGVEIVERQQLDQVMEELKLNQTGLIDAESMKGLGKILGVDAIVIGNLTDLGSRLDLDLRLIETETALLLNSVSGTLKKDSHIQNLLESRGGVAFTPNYSSSAPKVKNSGRIIRVPGDFSTIRQAIGQARDGDEIVVAPGEYLDYLDFQGKAITLRSEHPTHLDTVRSTIIRSGPANPTIVNFSKGEGRDAIIEGFTFLDSSRQAIFISNGSSPTIRNNRFLHNKEGALTILGNSTPLIENNHFEDNAASQFYFLSGGAIYVRDSAPLILDNEFINNRSARSGGGINVDKNSHPTIANNYFAQNQSGGLGGGAIYVVKESRILDLEGKTWPRFNVPPYTEPNNEYGENGKTDVYFQ